MIYDDFPNRKIHKKIKNDDLSNQYLNQIRLLKYIKNYI